MRTCDLFQTHREVLSVFLNWFSFRVLFLWGMYNNVWQDFTTLWYKAAVTQCMPWYAGILCISSTTPVPHTHLQNSITCSRIQEPVSNWKKSFSCCLEPPTLKNLILWLHCLSLYVLGCLYQLLFPPVCACHNPHQKELLLPQFSESAMSRNHAEKDSPVVKWLEWCLQTTTKYMWDHKIAYRLCRTARIFHKCVTSVITFCWVMRSPQQ